MSAALEPMIRCLAHRGPDQQGVWTSPESGIALGFRRLAIVDLSEEGDQPMMSASRRYAMTYNGEVYNFGELRTQLQARGHRFRGHSDTEVILAAFEEWGVEASFPRFNGMFALAVWDDEQKVLVLARDRLGIKPLYVYHQPGFISFGSELKALRQGPAFDKELDPSALASYLRYLCVPAPQTIYRQVSKLLPGCYLTIRSAGRGIPSPSPYWSLSEAHARGREDPIRSDQEAVELLEELLLDSVKLRLVSDVPLGALLSGGVDSSTVVALMQEASERPVKTYTIGFGEAEFDESKDARAIASHLGTDHTELRLTGADSLNVIPLLPTMFDEPHADPSPNSYVSRLQACTLGSDSGPHRGWGRRTLCRVQPISIGSWCDRPFESNAHPRQAVDGPCREGRSGRDTGAGLPSNGVSDAWCKCSSSGGRESAQDGKSPQGRHAGGDVPIPDVGVATSGAGGEER